MPAVLIEAGFINTDEDNQIFDQKFDQIADAIADGIEKGIQEARGETERKYGVQVGLFQYFSNAQYLQQQLTDMGYTVQVRKEGPFYAVLVGEETSLEDAVTLQANLREMGYDTLIVNL